MQWSLVTAHSTRNAEEEKVTVLRLVRNVVVNLASTGAEHDRADGSTREKTWVQDVEMIVKTACSDAGMFGLTLSIERRWLIGCFCRFAQTWLDSRS